jgi:hypothetical protein
MKYDVTIYVGANPAEKSCPAELKYREVLQRKLPTGFERCFRANARQEEHGISALVRKEDFAAAAAWISAAREAEAAATKLLDTNGAPVTIVVNAVK